MNQDCQVLLTPISRNYWSPGPGCDVYRGDAIVIIGQDRTDSPIVPTRSGYGFLPIPYLM